MGDTADYRWLTNKLLIVDQKVFFIYYLLSALAYHLSFHKTLCGFSLGATDHMSLPFCLYQLIANNYQGLFSIPGGTPFLQLY
jgi:hypothetical protein